MAISEASFISRRNFLRFALLSGAGLLSSCRQPLSLTSTPHAARRTSTALSTKLDTIVIVLQENHSFDSLFATYPGADGGAIVNVCPEALPHDLPHDYRSAALYQCAYTEQQIPNYWKLAHGSTLCDQYYSDLWGPSYPNYLMLTAAQSPIVHNPEVPDECPSFCLDIPAMPHLLDQQGLTWHDYGGLFANIKSLADRPEISHKTLDGFYEATAAGTLANVTWIGSYLVGGNQASGHPPADIHNAENFAVDVINAVMNGPQWPTTALFLVWDEWGGFYDHVEPPLVERLPDGTPFRYGYRVPCLVISPYARQGFVSHTIYSHVSILKTIETIFDLPPLTERDAQANSLLDCFDFSQRPISPFVLP
jgi:phospholipase C